jgi:fucose 4-O-acetylase-like acetyltransferase
MDRSAETLPSEDAAVIATAGPSPRYHALDRLRPTAADEHPEQDRMVDDPQQHGGGPGPMGAPDSSRWLSDWLHSFRMPLFFVISGFFGRMMLEKYGTREYLKRRWRRIAVPLLVGIFTFSPLYIVTRDRMAGSGFGPRGAPPGGPTMGAFGPPPPGVPMPGSFGPPPGGPMPERLGPPRGAFRLGGFGPPAGGPMPGMPGMQDDRLSDRLFGRYSRYFDLHHLWFLWYLLIFATVAPWVAEGFGWLLLRPSPEAADRLGLRIARWGLAPLVFGLVATPALMMTSSPFGWSLGLSPAIFRGFPDFLLHLDPDMAFYLIFLLWGWWLHRQREALPALGRTWLPSLLLGLIAFAASTALADDYGRRFDAPGYALIRTCGSVLYCLGSAWTISAFIGLFVRYLDRPSRTWRYLADTALWVYLIHQPLVIIGLALFRPLRLAWWAQTAAVSAMSVAAALLLYEVIVRPTPLVRLFGPASPRRPAAAPRPTPAPPII